MNDIAAQKIWNYMHLNHELKKCDIIFALGSSDTRVAMRAANLFLEGYGDILAISGGYGRNTKDKFHKPEAKVFASIAINMGVPEEKIITETKATNTGENIIFMHAMLNKMNTHPTSMLLVTKPYMERRTYATFKKQWPTKDAEILVTSPQIEFDDYFTEDLPKDLVLNTIVGDLQRIKLYAEKGFQIPQEIPDDVRVAYEEMVAAGYNQAMLSS